MRSPIGTVAVVATMLAVVVYVLLTVASGLAAVVGGVVS